MYGGSQTSAKDMNLLFPSSSTFKNSSEGGGGGGGDNLQRNREASMDVNLFHRRQPNHQPNQQQQFNSGLMRYRSAPSSLLEKLINGEDEGGCDNFIPPPTHSSPSEAESIFARFMSIAGNDSSDLREINEKSAVNNRNPPQFMEQETIEENNVFPPTSQMMFQNPSIPSSQPQQNSLQRQNSLNPTESPYRGVNSVNLDQNPSPLKMGSATNLIRHSSSPAGLFANLNVENGYAVMRGMGTTVGNSRLKSQMSFPSRPPTSSGLMSQISEIESEGGNSGEEGSLSNGNNRFIPGFPVASWDDGLENYTGVKRARDINNKMMNPSEAQSGEVGNHTTGLTHHFSLPKNSAEMAAILQYQDSVPCKIRAKRGCATHPRSIAERVRRTRISERMRKLQELVPNMDKQTNTADMLDLAVEYIKDLQTQVKTLNDNQVNCTCSNKQKL